MAEVKTRVLGLPRIAESTSPHNPLKQVLPNMRVHLADPDDPTFVADVNPNGSSFQGSIDELAVGVNPWVAFSVPVTAFQEGAAGAIKTITLHTILAGFKLLDHVTWHDVKFTGPVTVDSINMEVGHGGIDGGNDVLNEAFNVNLDPPIPAMSDAQVDERTHTGPVPLFNPIKTLNVTLTLTVTGAGAVVQDLNAGNLLIWLKLQKFFK